MSYFDFKMYSTLIWNKRKAEIELINQDSDE